MLERPRHVIAVGASAGGVEALRQLVSGLPADLDAAVCVVLHIPPRGRSLLAPILARCSALPCVVAVHGAPLERGTLYVAPTDAHLLVGEDRIELSHGPKENGVRPAVDPLFRSLARSWGAAGIAVVLSGALDDGAAGAVAVVEAHGRLVVQDPADAVVPGMPRSAIAVTRPTAVVPLKEIAGEVTRLAGASAPYDTPGGEARAEPDPDEPVHGQRRPTGAASGFTCPECRGALWEVGGGDLVRYRCRVGHAYSEDAMIDAQATSVETALWAALEALEERQELLRRVADRMDDLLPEARLRFDRGAEEAAERAGVIRRVLAAGPGTTDLSIHGEEVEAG